MAFGIAFDIGAYECKAALLRGAEVEAERFPFETPIYSIAYIDRDGHIIVNGAKERAERDPKRAIFDVKRRILQGAREIPDFPGITYLDVYVEMIREVLRRCNESLMKTDECTIDHVVLTIPGFLETRSDVIADMKRAAGSIELGNGKQLSVELLVEPAGVGLHNLDSLRRDGNAEESHTQIVYDLGHSTLDIALITSYRDLAKPYVLHHFVSDDETYGEYLTELIYNELCTAFIADRPNVSPRAHARLRSVAAELKHGLSESEEYTAYFDLFEEAQEFTMQRTEFERLAEPVITSSAYLVEEALELARGKGIEVNEVVLAGGGSSIPLVKRCIEQITGGIPVKRSLRPIDAVSFGGARYALMRDLTQRSKFTYGIQLPTEPGKLDRTVRMMIPADTELPCNSEVLSNERFVCNSDGIFRTTLYSTSDTSCRDADADDCRQVRHMTFAVAPEEPVEFMLEIDVEHCVKVVCRTPSDGRRYVMTSFDAADAVSREEE